MPPSWSTTYDALQADIGSSWTPAGSIAMPRGNTPHSVTITLSPKDGYDARTIDLRPSHAVNIGRSSRSGAKHMHAAPDNALFTSPVVSRIHAELRSSPWQSVTITDLSSLHGTSVNGKRLAPEKAFALKTGDVIKLGESVSRGDDRHDGVSLTVSITENTPESGDRYIFPSTSRSYEVPEDSDASDVESDPVSIVDSMKVNGFEGCPINLSVAPTTQGDMNDIADDDGSSVAVHGSELAKVDIIPDSLGLDEQYEPATELNFEVPPAASEAAVDHNASLPHILNNANAIPGGIGSMRCLIDDGTAYHDEADVKAEMAGHMSDMNSEENECATEFALSNIDSENKTDVAQTEDTSSERIKPTVSRLNRYDPVRGSQPPQYAELLMKRPPVSGFLASAYDGPLAARNACADLATDTSWDVPLLKDTSCFGHGKFWKPQQGPPTSSLDQMSLNSRYISCNDGGSAVWTHNQDDATVYSAIDSNSVSKEAGSSQEKDLVSKGKISINDLVQPADIIQSDLEAPMPGSSLTALINTAKSSKRSVDEIESAEEAEPVAKKAATTNAAPSTRMTVYPSHRANFGRRNLKHVTTEVAKATFFAGMGAAGFIAFLNSSMAERLIQHLA